MAKNLGTIDASAYFIVLGVHGLATGRRSIPWGRLALMSGYSRLQLPDYAARKKSQREPEVIQLPLLGLDGESSGSGS